MPYQVESAIIELETLTPLFIKGKDVNYGEGMLRGEDGLVYLIDNDKLCEYIAEKNKIEEYVNYFNTTNNNEISIKDFLGNHKIVPTIDELKKMAKGITNMPDKDKSKNKFIQNGNGKHFIPGSSIKGAIRNAVLWKILSDATKKTWLNRFVTYNLSNSHSNKKKYADRFSDIPDAHSQTVNKMSFTEITPKKIIPENATQAQRNEINEFNQRWHAANETLRDFFRIVKISDANFEGNVVLKNEVAKAVCKDASGTPSKNQSYQKKFPIPLECAPAKTKARFKISIDLNLAQDFFPSGIPFYLQSVSNLLTTVNGFFRAVAQFEETDFYNGLTSIPTDINPNDNRNAKLRVNTGEVYRLYQNRFGLTTENLFRTGWGGGFMSKTQFLHLTMPDRVKIRNLVSFNGSPIAPKSRCLIVDGQNAVTPLGWCKLTILPNSELLGIDVATDREATPLNAEVADNARRAEIPALRVKCGDTIEMRVIESIFGKSLTLEKDSDKLTIDTNKLISVGNSVKVRVLEVKDGKITKVKLL
jgi:CRISPR type III-A-associated RAMP protein Csm5